MKHEATQSGKLVRTHLVVVSHQLHEYAVILAQGPSSLKRSVTHWDGGDRGGERIRNLWQAVCCCPAKLLGRHGGIGIVTDSLRLETLHLPDSAEDCVPDSSLQSEVMGGGMDRDLPASQPVLASLPSSNRARVGL